jgi:hypothetical protein
MSILGNDFEHGHLFHASIKATSKNTVYKITGIPDWVKLIKFYPVTGKFTFAFNEDPAIGTDLIPNVTTKVIPFSGFSVGAILINSSMEAREVVLPNSPELRYASDTDNGICIIEFDVF